MVRRMTILYLNVYEDDPGQRLKSGGMRRYAAARGWDFRVLPRDRSRPDSIAAILGEGDVAGCVVECSAGSRRLHPGVFGSVPVVYLECDEKLYGAEARKIVIDNEAIARVAFRELSQNNPAVYASIGYPGEPAWSQSRIRTFRRLVTEIGGAYREMADARATNWQIGAELSAWLANLPCHTAVFAVNDAIATAAAHAARAVGKHIPRDLTLIGVDDFSGDATDEIGDPPSQITSIRLDFERIGWLSARFLDQAVSGKSIPGDVFRVGPLFVVRRESTRGFGRSEPFVADAVETIRSEACDGLTASGLISRFRGSQSLFNLRFREAMGHSVYEEILRVRMERVYALLARPGISIGAIAGQCGFGSGIALHRLFRRRHGMSMREWRSQHYGR